MDRVRNRQTSIDRPRLRDKQADGGEVKGKHRCIKRDQANWDQERQRHIKRDTETKTETLTGRYTSEMPQRQKKKDR